MTRRFVSQAIWQLLLVAFASVCDAQSDQQPPMHLLETPAKTRFGIFGQKPEIPAPTIFVLAMGVDDMEKNRGYSETGRQLATENWLYVTVDLPCHGRSPLSRSRPPRQRTRVPGWLGTPREVWPRFDRPICTTLHRCPGLSGRPGLHRSQSSCRRWNVARRILCATLRSSRTASSCRRLHLASH